MGFSDLIFISVVSCRSILEKLLNWASNYLAALPDRGGGMNNSSNNMIGQPSGSSGGGRVAAKAEPRPRGQHAFEVEVVADFDQFGRGAATPSLAGPQQLQQSSQPAMANKEHSSLLLLKHELFYAVVQAVCYVLCFHGTEMAVRQKENAALRSQWQDIVSSRLDPLRYCLRTVRVEFLKLAAHVGLFSDECWERFAPDLAFIDELRGSGVAAAVEAAAVAAAAAASSAAEADSRFANRTAGGVAGGDNVSLKSASGTVTTADEDRTTTSSSGRISGSGGGSGSTVISAPALGGNRILLNKSHLLFRPQAQQQAQEQQAGGAAVAQAAGAAYGRMDRATGTNPLVSPTPLILLAA